MSCLFHSLTHHASSHLCLSSDDKASLRTDIDSLTSHVQRIISLAEALVPKMEDVKIGEIGDLVDEEIDATTKAIEQAAARFEVRHTTSNTL